MAKLTINHDFRGGMGEPTICVASPALLNALTAATGRPVRTPPPRKANLV